MEKIFSIRGLEIHVRYPENPGPCIYAYVHQRNTGLCLSGENLVWVSISNNNYEKDFTPYPHPPVFRNGIPFSGKADSYLDTLMEILKAAETSAYAPSNRILAGYSLGGLFSLYATSKTDFFDRICASSASFWYPGFMDYVKQHEFYFQKASFSIGDKESQTKNPFLSKSEEAMLQVKELLESTNHEISFCRMNGGHFQNTEQRLMDGIRILL